MEGAGPVQKAREVVRVVGEDTRTAQRALRGVLALVDPTSWAAGLLRAPRRILNRRRMGPLFSGVARVGLAPPDWRPVGGKRDSRAALIHYAPGQADGALRAPGRSAQAAMGANLA
jgi:hypothetical protein